LNSPFILENIISLLPLIILTNPGTETTDTSLVREGALYRTKRSNSNFPSIIGITSPATISFLVSPSKLSAPELQGVLCHKWLTKSIRKWYN
jgi:hypothetical protein